MAHDVVIKNGNVIDGTGSPAFAADVAIDGDKITAIGKDLGTGKKEIDAKGHVVAPGFIDSHTHMDAFVVQYPNGNPVVNYGVTSIVIGDCGASCAPVPPQPEPRKVLVALPAPRARQVCRRQGLALEYLRRISELSRRQSRHQLSAAHAALAGALDGHGRSRLSARGQSRRAGRHEKNGARRHGARRHRLFHQPARRPGDSRRHAEHFRRA